MSTHASAPLSLSDAAVLAALGEGPAHGFKLAALFAKHGELGVVWRVQRPQVYRALEHLHARTLVRTVGLEPSTNGPPRLLYALSENGERVLSLWLSTPVRHLRDARSELLLKLAFLERRRGDTALLLGAQCAHFQAVRLEYQTRFETACGAERLALEWRLEALEAALRFLHRRQALAPSGSPP